MTENQETSDQSVTYIVSAVGYSTGVAFNSLEEALSDHWVRNALEQGYGVNISKRVTYHSEVETPLINIPGKSYSYTINKKVITNA